MSSSNKIDKYYFIINYNNNFRLAIHDYKILNWKRCAELGKVCDNYLPQQNQANSRI